MYVELMDSGIPDLISRFQGHGFPFHKQKFPRFRNRNSGIRITLHGMKEAGHHFTENIRDRLIDTIFSLRY